MQVLQNSRTGELDLATDLAAGRVHMAGLGFVVVLVDHMFSGSSICPHLTATSQHPRLHEGSFQVIRRVPGGEGGIPPERPSLGLLCRMGMF